MTDKGHGQTVKFVKTVNLTAIDAENSDILITCGSGKTTELVNTVWDDLRIVPGSFQFVGVSDPTLSAWQPGSSGATFQIYKFQTNDEVFFTCQLPHAYKLGTDIKAHVHWTPHNQGVTESGNTVNWALDYTWSNKDSTFSSSSTIAIPGTCTGTNDLHEVTNSVTISGTSKGLSSMIVCRLYRNTGDTWTGITAANSPGLLEFDLHFEKNTQGSRQELVK